MDYKKELNAISETIEKNKTEKTRIETKLESLKNDRSKLISELAEMGIRESEIDNLKEILADLEISIENEINRIKKELGE